jgi:ankyrin repeat protein
MTPLHWQRQTGRERVVRSLLKAGVDVTAEHRSGKTVLYLAVMSSNQAVVWVFLRAGPM